LLEHFAKFATETTSTFHEKMGNVPSIAHEDGISKFNSAKEALDKDLGNLLGSKTVESDVVYSVHFSDINGLSRLENNILAHEISEYLGTNEILSNLSSADKL
jgi:dihydroxyacetone kinase